MIDIDDLKTDMTKTILTLDDFITYIDQLIRSSMKSRQEVIELRKKLLEGLDNKMPVSENLDLNKLSRRRLQIFRLLGEDLHLDEIAKKLGLSRRTIDTHQNQIRRVLNLNSARDLRKAAKLNR